MVTNKGKISIIIPAFKAQETIIRPLSSIAEQTIVDKIDKVVIVNDCCPNGDYQKFIKMFSPFFPIEELKLTKNGGPGVARQAGINATGGEFFICIDADDTLNGAIALEILYTGINENKVIKCASGTFMQLGEDVKHIIPHQNDMVWMFGKLYRREFIEKYKIEFNNTRANEDTGFNTHVRLLCDNPNEQIRFIPEVVYCWHNKKDSITRINDGQYGYDQCFCGWTDNMIEAIQDVRKLRPFSGSVNQWTVQVLMNLYFYYIETVARKPVFADQNWEYVKKFYHACYKRIEDDITEQVLSEMYSIANMEKGRGGSLIGIIPCMGIKEFLDKLKKDKYNEKDIYKVWAKMEEDPETKKLMQNNIDCGVCAEGYGNKPIKM